MTEELAYDSIAGGSLARLDYRHVLDALADPVVAADAANRIVYVNRATGALLGWTPEDLVGQPLTVLIPSRFHEAHITGFHRFFATRVPRMIGRPVRVPALHRDGSEIDIELTLSAFSESDGRLLVAASLRDLRDRVELERQLSVTRYLRASTEAAAKLTSRLDLQHVLETVVDTLVVEFDAALARIWLYDPATNVLNLRASAGLARATAESSRAHIDVATYPYKVGEVARTHKPFVKNGLVGDPQFDQKWVLREKIASVAAFPLLMGQNLRGVVVYFARQPLADEVVEVLAAFTTLVTTSLNDIDLFRAEQAARAESEAARRRFAFLAEASTLLAASLDYQTTLTNVANLVVPTLADWCSVHVVDEDGSVRVLATAHTDPAKVRLAHELGSRYPFDPDAPNGAPWVLRTGKSELLPDIPDELLAANVSDPELLQILRDLGLKSSMTVPLLARGRTLGAITFVSAESGHRYGPADLAFAEDLARRAAIAIDNARLHQQTEDAVRIRDELLSSVSHDLKNPLTAITGQAQLLHLRASKLDTEEGRRIAAGVDKIVRAADRMNRLINDLVDVTRLRIGQPLDLRRDLMDLVQLVQQVAAEQQQTTSRHVIRVETAQPALEGTWDRDRLERVVANLLSNAVKYSPEGGDIVVRVHREEGESGPSAVLAVQDPGLGIPDDDLPHIFERFRRGANVTGRIAGTGIGLAGVKQIVEQHGGTVSVESREGKGSTFTVRLPLG